ncbi:putative ABC transporter permease [Eubacterium barkeri]|uniref:Uncharacterized membrane protein n=1 Tax=Eubacterium barkeri TaxID=1528 RepID=A0A1H3E2U0_EUBBA|nr:putative ABC transporter permease [Eubacterium barkeri]SDX72991.1 Uncharacterized membrane protein [Eubacterium barkeri]
METDYNLSLLFLYFFFYAVLGWCSEVVYCSIPQKKFVNRGFLIGPYCPIYGVGAIILIFLLTPFLTNPIFVFIVGVGSTSTLEYLTSWGMEKLFHATWWDYSSCRFNLRGRICLKNSVLFGIMSVVLLYIIHPLTADFLNGLPTMAVLIMASVLVCLMLIDLVISTIETIDLKNKIYHVSELADIVISDLRDLGVSTMTQFSEKLGDTRKAADALRSNAAASLDDLEMRLNHFAENLREKKGLHRYAHRRLLGAFPALKSQVDAKATEVYRSAMTRNKHLRKAKKQLLKLKKKDHTKER